MSIVVPRPALGTRKTPTDTGGTRNSSELQPVLNSGSDWYVYCSGGTPHASCGRWSCVIVEYKSWVLVFISTRRYSLKMLLYGIFFCCDGVIHSPKEYCCIMYLVGWGVCVRCRFDALGRRGIVFGRLVSPARHDAMILQLSTTLVCMCETCEIRWVSNMQYILLRSINIYLVLS